MMDTTDRHFRWFMRQITRCTLLYTEMITTDAILRGDRDRLLGFDPIERPLALQLGGDDPNDLSVCARIAEDLGYDEVNLNVGCPSSRVQQGSFGACLMARPEVVARAVAAMRTAVEIPVTVKHRIGIDDLDRYEDMLQFVDVVSAEGADRFTVHARKAWLSGLSPKQNRTVPPLRYEDVYRLKRERPNLVIEINGGIEDLDAIASHLARVDAVMVGRAATNDPFLFAHIDAPFYGQTSAPQTREEVIEAMLPYVTEWVARGTRVHHLVRGMLNLFANQPGARAWRRSLSEGARRKDAGPEVLRDALAARHARNA